MAVPEEYKKKLDFLHHMVKEGKVAAMEVVQKANGKSAVLLVGIEQAEDSGEEAFDIYPIARFDFNPDDFEAPSDA